MQADRWIVRPVELTAQLFVILSGAAAVDVQVAGVAVVFTACAVDDVWC